MKNDKNFVLAHCNIQGGLTGLAKTTEINDLIARESIDILGLNETNLKPDIDSSTLNVPQNYCLIRQDRYGDVARGGCGFLINKHLKFKNYNPPCPKPNNIEAIWIEMTDPNIYICSFYRSDNFCPLDIFLEYFTDCMTSLDNKKVVWIGDVNVNQNSIRSQQYRDLNVVMRSFGLIQTVQNITRVAYLGNKRTESIIDVVITNCYSNIDKCKVLKDRIGDHNAVKCTFNFQVKKADRFKKITIRDHSMKNIEHLKSYLGTISDYSPLLECENIDCVTDGLFYHIEKAYMESCPEKVIKCHNNYLSKPSKKLIGLIKEKRRAYKQFMKLKHSKKPQSHKILKSWENYKKIRNRFTFEARKEKKENIILDLTKKCKKNDLKGVWKTIKFASNLPTKKSKASPISNLDADKTNSYFSTIGRNLSNAIPKKPGDDFRKYLPQQNTNVEQLSDFEPVENQQIVDYILSIPSDKSITDNFSLKIFKEIIYEIIEPLTHIVNLSLKTGHVPACCRVARVSPIHKTGDPADPSNFRPISILPLVGKVIEYFVYDQLSNHINNNHILSNQQFGFRNNHSTTFLMLDLFDKIYTAKERKNTPGIIFLDIKKAFDSVSRNILIEKLKHYGITGVALKWFESYLSARYQYTKVGRKLSDICIVMFGVPQGSILGPILFSIYINDITSVCLYSNPFLFADDGSLYFDNIVRGHFGYLNVKLEMYNIFEWLRVNKLCLNPNKLSFLIFDKAPECESIHIKCNSFDFTIEETKCEKYLGLMIDNNLNFGEHIEYIRKKVAKRIGALYKSKPLLPIKFRKMFVNALMLPQFDYLDIIWSRTVQYRLNKLDILYKRVAKIALNYPILESSHKVYKDMKWLPLQLRRQLHLSSYMYKILNEKCPIQFIDKFRYVSGGTRNADKCNLYTIKSKSHKQFQYIGATFWNKIPQPIRESPNIGSFNSSIKISLYKMYYNDDKFIVKNVFDSPYEITIISP